MWISKKQCLIEGWSGLQQTLLMRRLMNVKEVDVPV